MLNGCKCNLMDFAINKFGRKKFCLLLLSYDFLYPSLAVFVVDKKKRMMCTNCNVNYSSGKVCCGPKERYAKTPVHQLTSRLWGRLTDMLFLDALYIKMCVYLCVRTLLACCSAYLLLWMNILHLLMHTRTHIFNIIFILFCSALFLFVSLAKWWWRRWRQCDIMRTCVFTNTYTICPFLLLLVNLVHTSFAGVAVAQKWNDSRYNCAHRIAVRHRRCSPS